MNKVSGVIMILSILLMFYPTKEVKSQTLERSEIAIEDTWDLTDLYTSDNEWEQARDQLSTQFKKIPEYKGKLSTSSKQLLACLELNSSVAKEFARLYSYAAMRSDQDTRESKAQGMKQQMSQMGAEYGAITAFIQPEILAMDKAVIDQFIAEEPGLKIYQFYLNDLQRRKAHTLSEKEEKILAESSLMADASYSIYSIFANAELPYPTIQLSDKSEVLINQAGYNRYRAHKNRNDREAVFDAFWNTMNQFRQTLGAQLAAAIKRDLFYTQARQYHSCLERALDDNNIPVSVYHSLIENVNANLNTFHRYLKLRQRMLSVDQLKYSDLYAPVVKGIELEYTKAEAQKAVLDALKPLGPDYCQVIQHAFDNRWIDVYPTTGKRSGAYSNGSAYDFHPYVLMNYNGQYEDVSTLVHELGHAMQSYFSNKKQPYPTADYPIFVAEVASTFNETLLIQNELKQIEDDDIRLSLLMSHLDGIKGTVFRQTQFAEFELKIHEIVEAGQPLTGDELTRIYAEIVRKYYGHDQNICIVPDLYTVEWSFIPHFYYDFYVYQYATSYTAAIALSEKVLSGEKGAVEKYLNFLAAGGSDYPINLLKTAGVDLTTTEPFNQTMKVMNAAMDEIEKILTKQGK